MKVIKRSIVFVALFVCLAKLGWSQTMLSVADLKNQTGETVNIADSVYSGQIFQKSVMVLSLGNPKKSAPLTLILYGNYTDPPQRILNTYQIGKISFRGLVLMSDSGPIVVLKDCSSLRFESLGKVK